MTKKIKHLGCEETYSGMCANELLEAFSYFCVSLCNVKGKPFKKFIGSIESELEVITNQIKTRVDIKVRHEYLQSLMEKRGAFDKVVTFYCVNCFKPVRFEFP